MYESNNIDWALLNVDTFFYQSRDTLTTHKTYIETSKDRREYIVRAKMKRTLNTLYI